MGQRIRPMKFFEVGDNGLQNVPVCQPMSGLVAEPSLTPRIESAV